MKTVVTLTLATVAIFVVTIPLVYAQKGVGDQSGVASQSVRPQVLEFSGKLVEIRIGLCEKTTGRSPVGTHIFLEEADGRTLNVHLGPAAAVADIVARLSTRPDQDLAVKAFRTEKMPEDQYVAISLTFDGDTFELRDSGLRPVWAGRPNAPRGRGPSQGTGRGRVLPVGPK